MPPRKMNPVAEWWQRQLGIIDNPNRQQDVVDMTDPAFAIQNLLGLVEPGHARAREGQRGFAKRQARQTDQIDWEREYANQTGISRTVQEWLGKEDSPARTNEVINMTGPAFAIQNLLGLVSPEQAQARDDGVPMTKLSPGKVSGGRNVTTATPSDSVRYAGDDRNVTTATPADEVKQVRSPMRAVSPEEEARIQGAPGQGGLGRGHGSRSGIRAMTPEEEAAQLGAPGSGGLPDATHRGDPRLPADPAYQDPDPFGINESYDNYLAMIDDMAGTYANLADSNMQEIAQMFSETAGVAQGGIAPVAQTYEQGQAAVGDIYGGLDERLGGIAEGLQTVADNAAGSAAGDVATTAGAAIAPFEAASATAKANAQANMAQHSNAGQGYLSNLASASVEEGKMHSSRVQAAADQRAAEFDIKRMELEMAREEALREVAMDAAGQAAEREAMAALFGAAGIPLPPGLDMGGAQAYVNLGQDLGVLGGSGGGSASEADTLRSQLNDQGLNLLEEAVQAAENSWTQKGEEVDPTTGMPVEGDRTQDFMFDIMAALNDTLAPYKENPYVLSPEMRAALENENILREIIRAEYGKF